MRSCCIRRTSASGAVIAFMPARSAPRSTRASAISDRAERWTSAPTAPAVRRRTTAQPSTRNTAATGWPRASCRSAPRCARRNRCSRGTARSSRKSTRNAFVSVDMGPEPGAGRQPIARASRPEESVMNLRRVLGLIVFSLAVTVLPAGAQHGQDAAPPAQTGSPNAANPTADSANEQRLLQEMRKLQGRVTIPDYKAATLEQPQGRDYQWFHERFLPWASGILIAAMILALAVFYFTRGRIMLEDSPESGIKIQRFNVIERLTHWMTATSFIVLALTGLNYFFGKRVLFPLIGP